MTVLRVELMSGNHKGARLGPLQPAHRLRGRQFRARSVFVALGLGLCGITYYSLPGWLPPRPPVAKALEPSVPAVVESMDTADPELSSDQPTTVLSTRLANAPSTVRPPRDNPGAQTSRDEASVPAPAPIQTELAKELVSARGPDGPPAVPERLEPTGPATDPPYTERVVPLGGETAKVLQSAPEKSLKHSHDAAPIETGQSISVAATELLPDREQTSSHGTAARYASADDTASIQASTPKRTASRQGKPTPGKPAIIAARPQGLPNVLRLAGPQ